MKNFIKSLSLPTKMIGIATFLLVSLALVAQQQQSGGITISSVSISSALPAGTNIIGSIANTGFNITGSLPTGSNTIGSIANTGFAITGSLPAGSNTIGSIASITNALPAGSNAIGSITNTGFAITGSLPAGTNTLGYVRNISASTCGTTEYDSGLALLPSSSTSVTSTATCVQAVILNNIDTVAHSVTVTDNSTACASGPCPILGPSYVIPALSQVRIPLEGAKLVGGVKWSADVATKVVGVVRGDQ